MSAQLPRQGDVLRLPSVGPVTPAEGHDLVVVFLGACAKDRQPDVPAYLRQLGFARTHVFELVLYWRDGRESTHVLSADSPREAGEAAVRLALRERGEGGTRPEGLSMALLKVGPVAADGAETTELGNTFLAWHARSGVPLERLLDDA